MGICKHEGVGSEPDGESAHSYNNNQSSNPFYMKDRNQSNQEQILSKYKFISKYKDHFFGQCSALEEKSTGDLFLAKEILFTCEEDMHSQLLQLQKRQQSLHQQNILLIKEIISKSTDAFCREIKKEIAIIEYPFMSFKKEIANRIINKIAFTEEEVVNFLTSTIKGYAAIERAGYKTDKVRLSNIFIGIKNKMPIIKVLETSLIAPKSNFQYFESHGPRNVKCRDIYLSPQEYQAWIDRDSDFVPTNKSGVFSLGVSTLDLCTMDSSMEIYLYAQRKMDIGQLQNRIEISGKKYGIPIKKILEKMLELDPNKRVKFTELEDLILPLSTKKLEKSVMRLSVIPSQRSSYISNDNSTLRSSEMFNSVISSSESKAKSRVFGSRVKQKLKKNKYEILPVIENYTNGNKYTGEKKGPLKHGKGRYQFKDGSYYEGDWFDNKMNGIGSFYLSNGQLEYEGEWRNDEYHGWGTFYSYTQNWKKYEGEFENGLREGIGKMEFNNGLIYEGQFRADRIAGRGRKILPNGEVHEKRRRAMTPSAFFQSA